MTILLKQIYCVLLPMIFGYSVLSLIFCKTPLDKPMKISLSYGIGIGTLPIWMFLLGQSAIPFNTYIISIPIIVCTIIFSALSKRIKLSNHTNITQSEISPTINTNNHTNPCTTALNTLLFIYILINIFSVFWVALNVPILSWDALATVAMKAKIFFFERTIPSLMKLPHSTYPLTTPLLETWVAIVHENWSDIHIKIFFPSTLLAFVLFTYSFIKVFTNRTWGLIGCVLLLSSNFFIFHATISYRDFLLMYFNCTTIMLLILWSKRNSTPYLFLSSLFAGFTTFTKLEGTSFVIIYLIMFIIISFHNKTSLSKRLKDILVFIIPILFICGSFYVYKFATNNLIDGIDSNNKTALIFDIKQISSLPDIAYNFFANMLFSSNWGLIWLITFTSIILWNKGKNNKETLLIFISILLYIGLYLMVAVFTKNYEWFIGIRQFSTISRLILHFYPLSILLIVLLSHSYFDSESQKTSF